MITRDTDYEGVKAQIFRGTNVAWVPQQTSWMITIVVEIEDYGKRLECEYHDFEGIGRSIEIATAGMRGFIKGFYAK